MSNIGKDDCIISNNDIYCLDQDFEKGRIQWMQFRPILLYEKSFKLTIYIALYSNDKSMVGNLVNSNLIYRKKQIMATARWLTLLE